MPLTNTKADSLRAFLTGAASDGGAQSDPDLSLGNYRSTTRAGSMGYILTNAIAGVRVDFVAGENASGTGIVSATSEDALSWQASGGTQGVSVTIGNGQTKVLEDGSDFSKFIVVSRTDADELTGTMSVRTVNAYNDVFGQVNAETGTGETFRCVCLKNGPAGVIQNLKVWINASVSNIAIGLEQPSAQPNGFFTTIPDQDTDPGVSFVQPTSAGHVDVLTVTQLNPNEQVAIWIRRDLTSTDAGPRYEVPIEWSYTFIG